MALSIDGSAHSNASTQAVTVTITTTLSNDIIVLIGLTNAAAQFNSVAGGGLTWTSRGFIGSSQGIEMWTAIAASPLSSQVITATQASAQFCTLDIFGVAGTNTADPFDAAIVTGASAPLTITTTNANTLVVGGFRQNSTAAPTAGSGWTGISGADYQLAEYQIFSSAQPSLSVTETLGTSDANGGVAQAFKAGVTGGGQAPPPVLGPGGTSIFRVKQFASQGRRQIYG